PAHDLGAVAVIAPANNATYCANRVDTVTAKVYNYGNSTESNFYVYASYTDSAGLTNTVFTKYTSSLASASSVNVYVGTINPPNGGKYKLKVYTVLATDTIHINDSSSSTLILTTLPILPVVTSDTVCPGTSVAKVYVQNVPNIKFQWYTSPTGTIPFKIDTTVSLTYPTKDSIFYVAAIDRSGCMSNKIPVGIAVRNAPSVDLGSDRTMCESSTFMLDAGNPGAKYLWSTGDTTESIHVTSSGTYSVNVYRYCSASDSVTLAINPLPKAMGINYVRSGNTYLFGVSGGQYINSYLWLFGDGDTSSQANPLHTYKTGNIYNVKVVLTNDCGSDTVVWSIPTGIGSLSQQDNTVKVYPNPASQNMTVSADNNNIALKDIEIINSMGATVYKGTANGSATTTINVSSFAAGHYILRLNTSKGLINRIVEIVH
ncbi:MAG: PKD domain-containing protein, partial [Flavipsychrobacter sp.]